MTEVPPAPGTAPGPCAKAEPEGTDPFPLGYPDREWGGRAGLEGGNGQRLASAKLLGGWALLGCLLAGHMSNQGSLASLPASAGPENKADGWVIKGVSLLSTSLAPACTLVLPLPGI